MDRPQDIRRPITKRMGVLREIVRHLLELLDATHEGLCMHVQGEILFANEELGVLMDARPENIVGTSLLDWIDANDQPVFAAHVENGGRPTELSLRRSGGVTVTVELRSRRFDYLGHRVELCSMRDVSEYRRVVEELEAERAMSASILEAALDPILSVDRAGRIQSANPATSRFFGLDRDELSKLSIDSLIPPPPGCRLEKHLAELIGAGEERVEGSRRRFQARRADGDLVDVELSVGRTSRNGILRIVCVLREVECIPQASGSGRRTTALGEVFEGLLKELDASIGDTGALVSVSELPTVEAPFDVMRQLFGNLLSTSLQSRREGVRPIVSVSYEPSVRRDDASGSWCDVIIRDNTSFSEDPKPESRVVELDESITRRDLGRMWCERAVGALGGEVRVEQLQRKGRAVRVTLPIAAKESL